MRLAGRLEDRTEEATGPTPGRPEVEDDRLIVLDGVFEVVLRDVDRRHVGILISLEPCGVQEIQGPRG